MLVCLATGFYSGLPFYLLIQFIPLWLRRNDIDLATIGLFSLIQLPYTWKFLWAPVTDGPMRKGLGRRRRWLLPLQTGLAFFILGLAWIPPTSGVVYIASIAFIVALFSATQDIVLDAYRRELLPDREIGLGSSLFVNAYRLAGLVSFSIAAVIADHYGYSVAFTFIAMVMAIGGLVTLWMPSTDIDETDDKCQPVWRWRHFVAPLQELWSRSSPTQLWFLLAFIVLYKLGDNMATALATPFYVDIGYSDTEIGTIAKLSALWASIAGGVLGGVWMLRLGIARALWIFGLIQMITILGYLPLSWVGASDKIVFSPITLGQLLLFCVVSLEYLGVGLGTVALTAFMLNAASRTFSATQVALLTSLAALPRVLATVASGFLIETTGYPVFFFLCFFLAIPGLWMVSRVRYWCEQEIKPNDTTRS